ncbi:laccase [Lanmaoa asiatica]|nr:laccase [Lanmaoa asiatica]
MRTTPHYVLVSALVSLSIPPVFATPEFQQERASLHNEFHVLGPVAWLNIVNKVIAPDGFPRSTVLAGGTFPGPLIVAEKGDDFKINVVNYLHDTTMDTSTSIHWHGIYQKQSNWADGVTGVTQCPVGPHKSFLHQFNAQDQSGTYWYHSHFSSQYCDGLRGPLVIYDPEDPHKHLYDIDNGMYFIRDSLNETLIDSPENTVITLADWYHIPSPQMYLPPYTANSTLINGRGRYAGGPMSPLTVINVEQGKRYRFRIIGASCDPWFNFTIDGHAMTVIETDGVETEPLVVDSLSVFAGQRYSVVVTANKTSGNYWIRALSSHPNQTFDGGQSSAILRYSGAPEQEPTTEHGPYILSYDESNVRPLIAPGAPGVPEPGKGRYHHYTINGVAYADPPLPVLLQILHGARHPSQLLPSGSVYDLPRGKVIELSVPATELTEGGALGGTCECSSHFSDVTYKGITRQHALHLHGHIFDVIRAPGSQNFNFMNPVRRDTVSIGSQADLDNVTIRFVTDNPGPWFIHCGFAAVMVEAPSEAAIQESQVVPNRRHPGYWDELCK